jgi:hypothetical protein
MVSGRSKESGNIGTEWIREAMLEARREVGLEVKAEKTKCESYQQNAGQIKIYRLLIHPLNM